MGIRTALAKAAETLSVMLHPGPRYYSLDLLPRTKLDYATAVGDGLGSNILMAPILWIARTFPEAVLTLTQTNASDEEEAFPDHEMLALLAQPNPNYSGEALWMATLTSWFLSGNAYWRKIRDKRTRAVKELWYVPHWMMQPAWPVDGTVFISHYEYTPTGHPKDNLPIDDVIHFRHGLDLRNPRKGLSPIWSALREVFTDDEASNYTASILKNMGNPGVVISPATGSGNISEPQAEALKEYISRHFTGDHRGKPMVMRGPIKLDEFGWSPKDMALGDLRNIPEERVCALLGIPAAVVGFGTGLEQTKVGATMREMISLAWKGCLIPNQKLLAAELTRALLPEFEPNPEEFDLWFDTAEVEALQESQSEREARMTAGVQGGWIRVDEARSRAGLEVDDADKIYLRSMAMIEIPVGRPTPEPLPAPELPPVQEPKMLKSAKAEGRARIGTLQRRTLQLLDADRKALTAQFHKTLFAYFEGFAGVVGPIAERVLNAHAPKEKADRPEPAWLDEDFVADQIMREVPASELAQGLANRGQAHYLQVAQQTFRSVGSALGIEIGVPDYVARRVIAEGGRHLGLVDIGRQLRNSIFDALWQGLEENEGPAALARRIRSRVPAGPWSSPKIRAEIISRTETLHAQRTSTVEGYRESGRVPQLMAIDNRLGFDDEDCVERNGQIVSYEEADAMMEEEHPNGTLGFVPYMPTPGMEE